MVKFEKRINVNDCQFLKYVILEVPWNVVQSRLYISYGKNNNSIFYFIKSYENVVFWAILYQCTKFGSPAAVSIRMNDEVNSTTTRWRCGLLEKGGAIVCVYCGMCKIRVCQCAKNLKASKNFDFLSFDKIFITKAMLNKIFEFFG